MSELAEALRRDGIYVLPGTWDGLGAFTEHLSRCPAYRNHVRQGKTEIVRPGDHPWTCHDMDDVVCAPGLLEKALELTPIAREYLETTPLLYSLNVFYCEPQAQVKPDIQAWHRDTDDVRFLALFVYCTAVNDEHDGPHMFMLGSHLGGHNNNPCVRVLGPAGTMFLADTRGLHMGAVPQRGRRMIAWARWGVTDPPASYVWDGLRPTPRGQLGHRFPRSHADQRTIRLVAA